ncbi:protein unc-45 homolog B [Contarinia nasturtii]|uniref:protein unc-45 homolog B n=1 Tax=Contarinia nasturtii TaxID=265458 RepID=UPI0012D3C58D|nr:protein unc-45 homolog B [Contarinia nasturtii]
MTTEQLNDEAVAFKEQGNSSFKNCDWTGAVEAYTMAIKRGTKHKQLATFYKNRAAAYLKLEKFELVVRDCNKSLELEPNEPKALFRRAQANEQLGRFEEAYRDAVNVWNIDKSDKSVKSFVEELHTIVQRRAEENAQTSNKVQKMVELAFDMEKPMDTRASAMNNILVLAREHVGADILLKSGVIQKIVNLLKYEKKKEISVNAIRTISEVCSRSLQRTREVLKIIGVPWFFQILNSKDTERVNAVQHCIQTILNSFSGMDTKTGSKPVKELCEENNSEIDAILSTLVYSITEPTISGLARDAIIEVITRNINYDALNWAERLIEIKGLHRLLKVCSEMEEYKSECSMEITPSSRTIAAVCLSRIYDNMYYDKLRERYTEQVDEFIKDKLLDPELEEKVRVVVVITAILTCAMDVGATIIGREGILQMVLAFAQSDDVLQQRVACECIVAACLKQDKAKAIMSQGVDILKNLYHSKDDSIKVRALVGLCKVGSSGGVDASIRPFADGATLKLAEACRRFLIKPGKDKDIRKWAADGLAYLTLDAEVKEKLCEDTAAIQSLIDLAKTGNQDVLYGIVTTFVNLCNAYDKQEILPEMVELAKFAKHHIPEEHELDDEDFINKRISMLTDAGIVSALVALSKTESNNSKELIARVLNAICNLQELRGKVVQQGGAKALLPLCFNCTEKGKRQAAQALSRIGITINPEIAFSGQRNLEVIRPLLNQLHQDYKALENFEALMALCNLAAMNDTVRQRIIKEGGLQKIEMYLMEDHLLLSRAATQVICNLVMSKDVVKLFESKNDRVKFLCLLCQEEDEETAMAAAGALAILTSDSKKCCEKMFEPNAWLEIFHTLIANPSTAVQHRGLVIVLNVIRSSTELAEKLLNTDVIDLLNGLAQLPDESRAKAREIAVECLKEAEKLHLVEKTNKNTE